MRQGVCPHQKKNGTQSGAIFVLVGSGRTDTAHNAVKKERVHPLAQWRASPHLAPRAKVFATHHYFCIKKRSFSRFFFIFSSFFRKPLYKFCFSAIISYGA
jgi:hypothetical protein